MYGLVTLIEVGGDPPVSVYNFRLGRFGLGVVEIWDLIPPHSVICGIFGVGGQKRGNKSMGSEYRVL